MKIQFMSDLHLEMCMDEQFLFRPMPAPGVDVLVLAGDIITAHGCLHGYQDLYAQFLRHCSENFKRVIMVMGNHEHYRHLFNNTEAVIKKFVRDLGLTNVFVLENQYIEIDGIVFYGCTMWTRIPVMYEMQIKNMMNDYHVVNFKDGNVYRKLLPQDTTRIHDRSVRLFRRTMEFKTKPVVMVTHHLPSFMSVARNYHSETVMNTAYYTELGHLIDEFDSLKVWIHGHTHNSCDYTIHGTHVVCNPRGYPIGQIKAQNESFDEYRIVEVQ